MMIEVVLDLLVMGYEFVIDGLELLDLDDCYVLVVVLCVNVEIIVMVNLKDFLQIMLKFYKVIVQYLDDFILDLIDLKLFFVLICFKEDRIYYRNLQYIVEEYFENLLWQGFSKIVVYLFEYCYLIQYKI